MLESALQHLPDAVLVLDPESARVLACNHAACEELGLREDELLCHSLLSLQQDIHTLPQWQTMAQAIREKPPYTFVGRHRHADGHDIPVEVRTSVMHHKGREYFLSVARNITQAPPHVHPTEVCSALQEAADGVWDWHITSGQFQLSPRLKQLLGYGQDEFTPLLASWRNHMHPDDARLVRHALNEHLLGRRHRYEAIYRLRNRNGHYLWVHDRGHVCRRDSEGAPERVIGLVHDITDLKNRELELQHHAGADSLTQLANRRRGEELAEQQLRLMQRLGKPLGLCLFDLDHFKQVNDVHGHLLGDQVLKGIAGLLRETVRDSDIVFRWGGEEFVLVCPDTDPEAMLQLADKLRRQVAAISWPAPLDRLTVTASMGVASFPRDGSRIEDLIAGADSALYRAKGDGRNRIHIALSNAAG